MEELISRFLEVRDGYGSGSGSGYGYGSGYGSGYGYGYGYGSGSGSGSGDGSGDGYELKTYENHRIWEVDGVQTLIYSVHGNYAKGAILQSDLTLKPCFIAKVNGFLAHGETLREAVNDANTKALKKIPLENRIEKFVAEHDKGKRYPAKDLFDWHHILTGSCRAGREAFCRDHDIDVEINEYSVTEFIEMTEFAYGGEIIKKLRKFYTEK